MQWRKFSKLKTVQPKRFLNTSFATRCVIQIRSKVMLGRGCKAIDRIVSSRCIKVAQRSCFSKTVLKNWQVNKRMCCVSALNFSFQEARVSSKGLPWLGTLFSQILYISVSWYNIPLIKFKVTLEKKRQHEKTFYFKHKVQVLTFGNNNLK